jgi:hypothetical protein
VVPELLHILISRAIRRFRHLCYVIQQSTFRWTQARGFEIAIGEGLYGFFFCSLNTQEVCMRIQSIGTAVEPRYPARDCFLGSAVEMTMGKMDGVAELHHLAQKVGAMAEALQDAGHVLAA